MAEPTPARLCAWQHCVRDVQDNAFCRRHFGQLPEWHRLRLIRTRRRGLTSRAYGRAVREAIAVLEARHIREMARAR